MSAQSTLFIAFSTGQNIANLLPILELIEAHDQVLWIESETAQSHKWSDGACEILAERGIHVERLQITDDPSRIEPAIRSHAQLIEHTGEVKLIANGGTKLQMMALSRALNGRVTELLYNHDKYCVLERYRKQADSLEPVRYHHYQRHTVDLPDVLQCQNREMQPGREERIWPGPLLELPQYGSDEDYTIEQHRKIYEWVKNFPDKPKKAYSYQQAAERAPHQHECFRKYILHATGKTEDTPLKEGDLEEIYNIAQNLDLKAWKNTYKQVDREIAPDVGHDFEEAVAARVQNWLHNNPPFAEIVQSVWRNVKIKDQKKQSVSAELDVAILLKNGRLLHLECKAYDASLKDMNSRLAELERSSSRLAKMVICVPDYNSQEDWAEKQQREVEEMKKWAQFKIIGFTLPQQKENTFEMQLEQWLGKWLLPHAA